MNKKKEGLLRGMAWSHGSRSVGQASPNTSGNKHSFLHPATLMQVDISLKLHSSD